ncbi:DUF4148 domain-containing protein [Roseateles sp. P5_E11]
MIQLKRALVASILAAVAHGAIAAEPAAAAPQQAAAVTRAEVAADYLVWVRSGMAMLVRQSPDDQPDVNSRRYRETYARYQQLRAAPEFRQQVKRMEQGGDAQQTMLEARDSSQQG